jgi:hypothetical protein
MVAYLLWSLPSGVFLPGVGGKANSNAIKVKTKHVLSSTEGVEGSSKLGQDTVIKPRSLRIKKLTINRMVANLRFEELNSGLIVSKIGQ